MTEPSVPGLRRDLGRLDAYAALIGILVGAGIYRASHSAYIVTGPSLVLGYAILAPVVLCIAIPYAAFQSTPQLGGPGGDYVHIRAVFGDRSITFLAAWLKIISYLGALVYLAEAMASYLVKTANIVGGFGFGEVKWTQLVATVCMVGFYAIHCWGVKWFGRAQVAMCLLLGFSILILVGPGLFAMEFENFQPFFTGGYTGFFDSLPILFFAYAGFEALAHTAGEVRDSHRSLPAVFLRGTLVSTFVFFSMSAVAVGVLGSDEFRGSEAPMAQAAEKFLPGVAAVVVAIGGVFAAATSVNATFFVPPRLMITLARDRHIFSPLASVHPRTGTPVVGLTVCLVLALVLLWSGRSGVALGIAVLALMSVYLLHSIAFLWLRRSNQELADAVDIRLPRGIQLAAAWIAVAALGVMISRQVSGDVTKMLEEPHLLRTDDGSFTSTPLLILWILIGVGMYNRVWILRLGRGRKR